VNTRKFVSFVRLSRPTFLIGGIVMYALGALIARYEGVTIELPVYVLGQIAVTSIQLMGHYFNEYWDVEGDRITPNRTFFTGGSGVLPAGEISRRTAFLAAAVCLFVGSAAMLGLSTWFGANAASLMIFVLGLAGVWSYSGPPLRLSGSGFGELVVALMVSLLVPSLGYQLQRGHFGYLVVLAAAPLVAINWLMLILFELPDVEADRTASKHNLVVRLGYRRTQWLVTIMIIGGFGLLAGLSLGGLPRLATLGLLVLPLALPITVLVRRVVSGRLVRYFWLTFGAVAMFALMAILETLGIFLSA